MFLNTTVPEINMQFCFNIVNRQKNSIERCIGASSYWLTRFKPLKFNVFKNKHILWWLNIKSCFKTLDPYLDPNLDPKHGENPPYLLEYQGWYIVFGIEYLLCVIQCCEVEFIKFRSDIFFTLAPAPFLYSYCH